MAIGRCFNTAVRSLDTPAPHPSTTSPMPLGQHVFGSVFNSVRMLCECFHHHVRQRRGERSPAPAPAPVTPCAQSREAAGIGGGSTTAPHARLLLGGRSRGGDSQSQRQQCHARHDALVGEKPLFWVNCTHHTAGRSSAMGMKVGAHQTPCISPRAVLVNEGPRVCWGLGACTRSSLSHNLHADWLPALHPRACTTSQSAAHRDSSGTR